MIINSTLEGRGNVCFKMIPDEWLVGVERLYIAGGCIATNQINDIDVYVNTEAFVLISNNIPKDKQAKLTNNALSVTTKEGKRVQICRYWKDTLEELVDSFDFAHIQAGVEFIREKESIFGFTLQKVYLSENKKIAGAIGESFFVGSEYPLSSLLRVEKYQERGAISKTNSKREMLKILIAVIERGFIDYEDFKKQLDAIDLQYMVESDEAYALYNTFKSKGLVKECK